MCKYVAYNRFYQLRFYIYIGCFIIPIYTEIRCLQHSVTYYDRVTALSRMFLHNVKCLRYGTFREGGNRHKLEPVAYHCVCNILSFEMRVKRIFLRAAPIISHSIGLEVCLFYAGMDAGMVWSVTVSASTRAPTTGRAY